ncbi:MAG: IS630 family transposase [Actinomycetota bacterium]|nr:IS630 family transposase [Actinomycetota bacterium]
MARRPEVFVRALTDQEQQRLVGITRRSRDPVRLRRAMIVQMSAQGRSVQDIAELTAFSERYIREVIHAFNDQGFAALDPKWSGGRPKTIDDATRRAIRRLALSRPPDLDLPFTTWSLTKLRDHLVDTGVVADLSLEGLRRVLAGFGITFQATKTWKASPDPDFEAKKNRILDLYDHPPADGRVVCFDEFGPLNLQPHAGHGWFPKGRPARLRATYTRPHGVRQMLAALDLASGQVLYRIHRRKRWQEFLGLLKILRARWPGQRLYIVLDNFSPHRRQEVRDWCDANDVDLVFTPTYASWLNWIEAEFTALRYFTLNGSDYTTHAEQAAAVARYIRWRNRRAAPKRDFAVNSPIRHRQQPDYLNKVA